ncbi:hypothetical protein AAFF_G00437780 [Aldrovandia affinis]|uniref:Uncharacterized protein n=1 Tax=Aldrovandia affinis TaxID=143900 RepID=A0AAD7S7N8_9TELE|nr:hypothetical protein AAFF_G00437780 [Aldrovandia affinis]
MSRFYYRVRLNKEGVKMFAKVLKDPALGRSSTSVHSEMRKPGTRVQPPWSPRPPSSMEPLAIFHHTQPPAPSHPCNATVAVCSACSSTQLSQTATLQ